MNRNLFEELAADRINDAWRDRDDEIEARLHEMIDVLEALDAEWLDVTARTAAVRSEVEALLAERRRMLVAVGVDPERVEASLD